MPICIFIDYLKKIIILLKRDCDLVNKMHVNQLKNYQNVRGLKISGNKNQLVARVFSAIKNNVIVVKTAVEVEEDLEKEYEIKLRVDNRLIPDPFKIPHGWLGEDEGMAFWPMLLYPHIFKYLMFYPTQPGNTDLGDYKNSKAYIFIYHIYTFFMKTFFSEGRKNKHLC